MWKRLTTYRHIVCHTATTARPQRYRPLLSHSSASFYPRTVAIAAMSTTSASKPSSLPAQLTDMCMSHTHFQAFQGNPLNKLHFHRKDEQHMQKLQALPAARFLVLNTRLQPLLRTLPALPAAVGPATPPPTASLATIRTPLSTRAVITWFTSEQLSSVLSHSPIVALLGQVDNEAPIATTVTAAGELVRDGRAVGGHAERRQLRRGRARTTPYCCRATHRAARYLLH